MRHDSENKPVPLWERDRFSIQELCWLGNRYREQACSYRSVSFMHFVIDSHL